VERDAVVEHEPLAIRGVVEDPWGGDGLEVVGSALVRARELLELVRLVFGGKLAREKEPQQILVSHLKERVVLVGKPIARGCRTVRG
jgi:hypothetical protein